MSSVFMMPFIIVSILILLTIILIEFKSNKTNLELLEVHIDKDDNISAKYVENNKLINFEDKVDD